MFVQYVCQPQHSFHWVYNNPWYPTCFIVALSTLGYTTGPVLSHRRSHGVRQPGAITRLMGSQRQQTWGQYSRGSTLWEAYTQGLQAMMAAHWPLLPLHAQHGPPSSPSLPAAHTACLKCREPVSLLCCACSSGAQAPLGFWCRRNWEKRKEEWHLGRSPWSAYSL